MGFIKPTPVPLKTRTRERGYGFSRVRVRVSPENPRVARDNPYLSLALAPGRLDPGPVGSGQGRVRVDPDTLIFSSGQIFFFFKCCNFDNLVDFYVFVKY